MNKSETLIFFTIVSAIIGGFFLSTQDWSSFGGISTLQSKTALTASPTPSSPPVERTPTSEPAAKSETTQSAVVAIMPSEALSEVEKAVGPLVVSLAQGRDGIIWAGTEGAGVIRIDEQADPGHRVTRYNHSSGLADDNIYGLCVDKENRVWVGHLNHGVSVYNGKAWRNYDVLDGPIGERIYGLNCSVKDGSIWMATNAGVTRYDPNFDLWESYTEDNGLPENQATCITSDPNTGDILVGMKTKGLAIARASENYKTWTSIPYSEGMTQTPEGDGVPTGMINDVLINKTGVCVAATTQGLSWSTDQGHTWKYRRGEDWPAKLKGLAQPRVGFKLDDALKGLVPEDYVASLAEMSDGQVALGLWDKGLAAFNPVSFAIESKVAPEIHGHSVDYVNRLLTLADGRLLTSCYGKGIFLERESSFLPYQSVRPQERFPSPVAVPTLDQVASLNISLSSLAQINFKMSAPKAVFLSEDWRTEGKWLGRYGKFWACLCAMLSPNDYIWGSGDQSVSYYAYMSNHRQETDSLRYWISELATTRPGSLEMPPSYLSGRVWRGFNTWAQDRRQSEWDDHGEGYSRTFDGPHVCCNIEIPSGHFILSYYNINKDGQSGSNRFRDYRVSVRENKGTINNVTTDFNAGTELSSTRTMLFSGGGAYASWLVQGPCSLTVEVNRNYSFNTIFAGLLLDQTDELPAPYLEPWENYRDPDKHELFLKSHMISSANASPDFKLVAECLERLRFLEENAPQLFCRVQRSSYLMITRYLKDKASGNTSATQAYRECLFHIPVFDVWEQMVTNEFGKPPRSIENSVKLQQDLEGNGNGRQMIERYAGYSPIHPKLDPPPKENKLSSR